MLRIRLFGGISVEVDGRPVPPSLLAGRQGRLALAYLLCAGRPVTREELAEVLWPDELPDSWPASLSAVVSRLRRLFTEVGLDGQQVLLSSTGGYQLVLPEGTWVDWHAAHEAVQRAEHALEAGDAGQALAAAGEAATIVDGGFLTDDCEWVDRQREVAHDLAVRAAVAKAAAHLAAGSPRRAVEEARDALRRDPLREATFRLLMRALAVAGERAEALRMWEHCRTTLVEELGVDPSPETEAVYLEVLGGSPPPPESPPTAAPVTTALPSGVVTFLLTDIVESSTLWERHPAAMAAALERHDALVAEVIERHGGTVLKSKLEGDATVSVFARATAGANAALALRDALEDEEWPAEAAPRVRMAIHTGEAFERGGDYFGPALNRAARLRSLAAGGQVLLSQAVAELVADHLPEGIALADRGHRDLRGLSRGENVYELVAGADEMSPIVALPLVRPDVPVALVPTGPFVGRADELSRLTQEWEQAAAGSPRAVLLAGEPGVGKSRLAAESARAVHDGGGLVLYGRCDEDLGAPLQPFIDAIRPLVPALGAARLRQLQGVDELSRVIPELSELLPEVSAGTRADPDAERHALFDAITRLLATASAEAPALLVLDDLHWAGKTTLTLVRHLLRNAESARLLVMGTYRDTELARTHPLAAMLTDLRREGSAQRITLEGLGAADVTAYLEAVGRPDRALGRELARVTSGNPFFLIETLRHVEETGGRWEEGGLPQGVREATGARLSRLSDEANNALSVAAVAGTTFSLELVEAVRGVELVDEVDEACRAGLVAEEPGVPGTFRFAHALVRQVLLAELVTVKRVRLHRRIAELLEESAGDGDDHLTELAHHWFECAPTGSADKAVAYCRRAADQAVERLAFEEAADLYGMALQALEGLDGRGASRDELLLARCDALLTAGEVDGARGAIEELEGAASSPHLRAWHAVFAAQLAVLAEPDRLTDVVESVGAAAAAMRDEGDVVGEAKAHYVHALALDRLGQIGASERALDAALAAARTAGDRRLADAVLAGAPQAALWGPSPVTRASGRCLDVVRVLRITSGAPAVEAVALRCQAVLEALRGRMDAARRMIDTARGTVEELGLTLRLLETEVMAGLIELLDGAPEAAEALLRPAYEALRDRGLGGEAALAGALLGRSLLAQGRDAEAEAVAEEASQRAGSDLKAAITWRGVLAEAAARRGDTDRALELAREAVELATATDALLLVADARRSLTAVLWLTGDAEAAQAEARRTAEVCDAKGATALAARARSVLGQPRDAQPAPTTAAPAGFEPPSIRNAAVRAHEEFVAAWAARDLEQVEALCAPSWQLRDVRRQGSGLLTPEESRASRQYLFDGDRVRWVVEEVLATRGDRLWLSRQRLDIVDNGETTGEWRGLVLLRIDVHGLRDLDVLFDEDAVDAAFEELDRLYAEGEASSAPVAWRGLVESDQAINAADPVRLRACLAPGFVGTLGSRVIERTPRGPDEFVEFLLGMTDLRPDVRTRYRHVLALEPTRALVVATRGTEEDFELNVALVFSLDAEGRVRRQWAFAVEELDEAWHQYHELGADDLPIGERFPNAATRLAAALDEAWNTRDAAAWRALFEGAELTNRRMFVEPSLGPMDILDGSTKFVFEGQAEIARRSHPVATRGDRLALVRVELTGSWGGAGPSEIPFLVVFQVDQAGAYERGIVFDVEDLDAAYERLDLLFTEGEGARGGPYWERSLAIVRALHQGDEAAMIAEFSPQFRFVPHGPLRLWGELDRVGFVAHTRGIFEVRPDARIRVRHVLAIDAGRALTVGTNSNRDDADDFEMPILIVTQADADGRPLRRDSYSLDQMDEAWARYEELGRSPASVGELFPNAATRRADALCQAFNACDFHAFAELFAPEYRFVSNRLTTVDVDRNAYLETMRSRFDQRRELRWDLRPLATRGDRLALMHHRIEGSWDDAGDTVLENVLVTEVDAQGKGVRAEVFEVDELDAAYVELDRWYLEGEGEAGRQLWERSLAFSRDLGVGRVEEAMGALAPGFKFVDNRALGWGELDGPGLVAYFAAMRDMRPEASPRIRHVLALEARRSLTVFGIEEATGEADFELIHVYVVEADEDGRAVRRDSFSVDQLDQAWARYDEIGQWGATPVGARFPNAATRRSEAQWQAWKAQDFEAFSAGFAPDYLLITETRLTVAETTQETREQYLDGIRQTALWDGSGDMRWDPGAVLATRGDRLALIHWTQEGPWRRADATAWEAGDTLIERVRVTEVDDEGLLIRTVFFEADDLDAAFAEMDRRYAEIDRPGAAWGVVRDLFAAINRQDYEYVASLLAPGFRMVSHRRPLDWGTLDANAYVDYARTMSDLRGDIRYRVCHVLAVEDHRALTIGTLSDAGADDFEIEWIVVAEVDGTGRFVRADSFGSERLDDAFARYHAIGSSNAALRNHERLRAAWEARDLDSVLASFASTWRLRSRHAQTRGDLSTEESFRSLRTILGAPQSRWVLEEVVATRGDRLALGRLRFEGAGASDGAGPFEHRELTLWRVDHQGRRDLTVDFDEGDVAAALAELDRLYAEADGTSEAEARPVERVVAAVHRAIESADWKALRELCADDMWFEDQRPTTGSAGGSYLFLEKLSGAMGGRVVLESREVSGNRLGTWSARWDGVAEGLLVVEVDRAGLLAAVVIFAPDQWQEAQRELHRRFRAGEGAPFAAVIDATQRYREAFHDHDADAMRKALSPDVVVAYHRVAIGMPLIDGADAYLDALEHAWRLSPDVHMGFDWLALAPNGVVIQVRRRGELPDGGLVDDAFLILAVITGGRIERLEAFDDDDIDNALRRFGELSAAPGRRYLGGGPARERQAALESDNRATRAMLRFLEAMSEPDEARATLAADVVFESRRRGVGFTGDAEALLASADQLQGVTGEREVLATAGQRVAVEHHRWHGAVGDDAGPFDTYLLMVVECDEEDRLSAIVSFDPADRGDAMEEMYRRYFAGEGAAYADMGRMHTEGREVFNAADWTGFRNLLADDFTHVDHEVGALYAPTFTADEWVELCRTYREATPDVDIELGTILAIAGQGNVVRTGLVGGVIHGGGDFRHDYILVDMVRDGLLQRTEFFSADDLEGALARFEELVAAESRTNAATRMVDRFLAAWTSRDWAALCDTLAQDCLFIDRRSMGGFEFGRDDYLTSMRESFDSGTARFFHEVLETRGERLALYRMRWLGEGLGSGPSEVHMLEVDEVDADGRLLRNAFFDPDDLVSAHEVLDAWYAEREP